MNYLIKLISVFFLLSSCSSNKNVVYLQDYQKNKFPKVNYSNLKDKIEVGDILKIDVNTVIPEASLPYTSNESESKEILNGYLVTNDFEISFPLLGNISVINHDPQELSEKIKNLLVNGGHLTNPHVNVRKVNSKFTVLGEVRNPGTFSFYESKLTVFQALGFAGDLLITGKRNEIKLIRHENGLKKIYSFSLTSSDILNKPYYYIKNNDVIIIKPNYSQVKSAGFVGSPTSIASLASILLSITLLIINK